VGEEVPRPIVEGVRQAHGPGERRRNPCGLRARRAFRDREKADPHPRPHPNTASPGYAGVADSIPTLLHAALLSLPVAVPRAALPLASEVTSPAKVPVVVLHHEDAALRDRLLRGLDVWHDAGRFLVGEASRETLRWLDGLPVDVVRPAGWTAGADLYVVEFSSESTLDRITEAGGEVLFRHAPQALVALLPEDRGVLEEVESGSFMHHALMPIREVAQAKPRAFAAPSASPAGTTAPRAADPAIAAMVAQVDQNNLIATVQSLSSIFSRRCNLTGAVTAQNQLEAQLQGYGLSTSLQDFGSSYSKNVVAELPGVVDPSKIIVVGGHYDSINGQGSSYAAPGADDNASGTAGVLETARVLAANGPFKYTVRFIAFSGEELGLYGSEYAATLSDNLNEDIIAMINMDMISYRASGDSRTVDFITNYSSSSLISFCQTMGATYVSGWASNSGSLSGGTSDHQSYATHGFPAIFFFEDVGSYSPYIHSANDTYPLSANDFTLAEMFVECVVASTATLAELVDLSITHTPLGDAQNPGPYDVDCQVTSLTGANVTAVTLYYSTDGTTFTAAPMTPLGGSDWQGAIPDAGSPVTHYYYLEAEDDQGGSETLPGGMALGEPPFSFFCGEKSILYFNDFEGTGDEGWTHGQVATQDDWQRGDPFGQGGDPQNAYSGTKVWANDLGASGWNGEYATNTHNWLASPVFDLSGETSVTLEFQRWLTVESGQYDQAQIRVNGTVVWQNESSVDHLDTGWTKHTLDISSQAAGNPSVQIQFRMISDGGVQYGGWNIDDFSLVVLGPIGCPAPTTYCTTSPNSVGSGAEIGFAGTTSLAANDLVLTVQGGPPDQFALFYYGPNQISIPFGEGVRCVGGGIFRLNVVQFDMFGNGTYALDVTNPPQPSGQILEGSTWNFQCWYRDPSGGPSGFNFSDALEAVFCP